MIDFSLHDRVVLVTGGTSGLGRAVAEQLASLGARVVVGSTQASKVDETCAAIGAAGHTAAGFVLDVRHQESVEQAVVRAQAKFGPIDGLVNAAGLTPRAPTHRIELDEWRAVLDTNLLGSLLTSRACLPSMREAGGGSIVNVASLAAYAAFPDLCAYGASKSALLAVTRSLATEWAQWAIRVNAVVPGVFITDTNSAALEGSELGERICARTPMGRFGKLAEVAGAVAFLLGRASSFVTGSAIIVDGGFLASAV